MNLFKTIGNFFSRLFKSPQAKRIMDLGVQILKATGERQAERLAPIAYEAVKRAELEGGSDKYEQAFKAVRGAFSPGDLKEDVINVAIEIALQALKQEIAKRGIKALTA